MRLEALFSACCPGSDFTKIRKLFRRDLEVTGNAYLGVRRDNAGDVAEFEYLPSVTMRLRPTISEVGQTGQSSAVFVPLDIPVRSTPITWDRVTTYRTFRTFVQFGLVGNVFFKQFGDPRDVSARDGRLLEPGQRERGEPLATEVVHFKIPSALFEYGVPRWIGATPVVTGLRASQEVNATHFDNNGIPRMLFLVSGGTLKEGADQKLTDILRAHAQGRDNYGRAVILQATPASNNPSARVQIEAKPLKEAIPDDGLFLNYGARCRDEILSQFRLPKFITGQLDDVNRSTAREGVAFVEDQVFQPMRRDFDVEMEAILMSEGVLFWHFVSNSPVSRDPETAAKIVASLAQVGGPSINDVRRAMSEIQNEHFAPFPEAWADLPYELAKLAFAPPPGTAVSTAAAPQAVAPPGEGPEVAPAATVKTTKARTAKRVSTPRELVEYLLHARDMLERGEADGFAATFDTGSHGDTLVLPLSGEQIAELVEFG
jgi:capsid portal protein